MQNCFKLFSLEFFWTVVVRDSYSSCPKVGQNQPPRYGTCNKQVSTVWGWIISYEIYGIGIEQKHGGQVQPILVQLDLQENDGVVQ